MGCQQMEQRLRGVCLDSLCRHSLCSQQLVVDRVEAVGARKEGAMVPKTIVEALGITSFQPFLWSHLGGVW